MGLLDRLTGKGKSAHGARSAGGAVDPVCKMSVDPATAKWSSQHGPATYHFCSAGCKTSFDADPHQYLGHHEH